MPVEKQITIIYAVTNGLLDHVPVDQVERYEKEFHAFMEDKGSDVLHGLRQEGKLTDEIVGALKGAIEQFNASFTGE